MDSKPIKRKSINLILLIFIVLAIIVLIILTVYFINHSRKSDNDTESTELTQNVENNSTQIGLETDTNQTQTNNTANTNSTFNALENFENFEDITTNEVDTQTSSAQQVITFNNHKLIFDDSVDASIVQNYNTSELQLNYLDFNFKMLLGTDKSTTFENLKSNNSLKSYLESTYNISITSSLKSGNLIDLDIIICTISDNNGQAYFVITPLNNSEIIYSKIYNTSDNQTLIEDLSKPLEEISSIISKLQN